MDGRRSDLPAVAGLPAQRPPAPPTGADVLRALGLDALVELVEGSPTGLGVTAEDDVWRYLNPAARRLLGPTHEQPDVPRLEGEALGLVAVRPEPGSACPDAEHQVARDAVERERHRLGRDLHDSVSSALFALHTRTQVVDRALAAGDLPLLTEAAKDMQALSGQAIAELRALVSAMREDVPAATAGDVDDLPAALERLAATTLRRDGLDVELRLGRPVPAVPAATAEHLTRIAAEAVHNCRKHAGVGRVRVDLHVRGSELVLAVTDEGRGFDAADVQRRPGGRHGQRTMRERAVLCGGWLHVDTAPGRGTRVVARVPLPG